MKKWEDQGQNTHGQEDNKQKDKDEDKKTKRQKDKKTFAHVKLPSRYILCNFDFILAIKRKVPAQEHVT